MEREIKERIKSIIYVLVFLVGMTWFWYGPREDLAMASADLGKYVLYNDIELVKDGDLEINKDEYQFTITNKKNYDVNYEVIITNDYRKQRRENCNLVSNNYLQYNLKIDGEKFGEKNLPVSGVLYHGELKANETKLYSIKLLLDESLIEDGSCYYPVVKASTYNKI